jgi:hypothetical protein
MGSELTLSVPTAAELVDGEQLLAFVVDYVTRSGAAILPEETLTYGSWLLKFRELRPNLLDVWERLPDQTYVRGAERAMRFVRVQREVCARYKSGFAPPIGDQLVVIDEGIYDIPSVEGSRYAMNADNSGWILIRDGWKKNVDSFVNVHVYHLLERRPDLVRFLALPVGWRFFTDGREETVEFDPSIS